MVQVRIQAPNPDRCRVQSWTLPCWMIGSPSYSVGMALGGHPEPCIFVHGRIAREMGIRDGYEVEFEFPEIEQTFTRRVVVSDQGVLEADCVFHGAMSMGIMISESIYARERVLEFPRGRTLTVPHDTIWAGIRIQRIHGKGLLRFAGASRNPNDPSGPSGYGYYVKTDHHPRGQQKDLVRGYGYYDEGNKSEMEFKGIVEGLTWAVRFDLKLIRVQSDSALVIRQCTKPPVNLFNWFFAASILASVIDFALHSDFYIDNWKASPFLWSWEAVLCYFLGKYLFGDPWCAYRREVMAIVKRAKRLGTDIVFEAVPHELNAEAHQIANQGIEEESHLTLCNWSNINEQCRQDF